MLGHDHAAPAIPDHAEAAELQASRIRIVEAADEARRRIERDLHDGAQQRFVSASLLLGLARRRAKGNDDLSELLDSLAAEIDAGLAELRELAQGIHPTVLADHGVRAAVDGLAARCSLPVSVYGDVEPRPASAVESALYFTVAEALTNVAKYADADDAVVRIRRDGAQAEVEITDDGRGGADPTAGSGLRGLVDRLGALGGHLHVESAEGEGTTIRAIVPVDPRDPAVEVTCGCCEEGRCRCGA
jgi:signal transduction histidine kinase